MRCHSPFHRKWVAGFTLTEVMITTSILSLMMAGTLGSVTALQQMFVANSSFSSGQNDQMRVLDYITRDSRNALGVTVSNAGAKLTLYLPTDYDTNGDPIDPSIAGTGIVYDKAAPFKTVSLYREGNQFVREDTGVKQIIADQLDVFAVNFSTSTITVGNGVFVGAITSTVTFAPQSRRLITQLTRDGTNITTVTCPRNLTVFGMPKVAAPTPPPVTKKKKKK